MGKDAMVCGDVTINIQKKGSMAEQYKPLRKSLEIVLKGNKKKKPEGTGWWDAKKGCRPGNSEEEH